MPLPTQIMIFMNFWFLRTWLPLFSALFTGVAPASSACSGLDVSIKPVESARKGTLIRVVVRSDRDSPLERSGAVCVAELTGSELGKSTPNLVHVERARGSSINTEPATLEPQRYWRPATGSGDGSRGGAALLDPLTDVAIVQLPDKGEGPRTYRAAVRCVTGDSSSTGMGEITFLPDGTQSPPNGPSGEASPPQPAEPGGWDLCTHNYDLYEELGRGAKGGPYGNATIFAPVTDTDPCRTFGRFGLVLIAHADGIDPPQHRQYDALATHLARNAFVVVSMNRYVYGTSSGAHNHFLDLVKGHLDYLYGSNSPVAGLLADQFALMGHSAGGKSSTMHAQAIDDHAKSIGALPGKDLAALIVLAPTVQNNVVHGFDGVVEALLAMHGTHDMDPGAFGPKNPKPMLSTFKVYDDARVVKDMVFLKNANHWLQDFGDGRPAKAYINSFLQLNLNGHGIFDRFLKLQERPPDLAGITEWQQHSEPSLVVADFEAGADDGAGYSSDAFSQQVVGESYATDEYSPHNTRVLKFRLTPSGAAEYVEFAFPAGGTDLSGYGYVSFRASQVFDPDDVADAPPLPLSLALIDETGVEVSVPLEDLHFPIEAYSPTITGDLQTKNAMRSYIVGLGQYQLGGVDIGAITAVRVLFPFNSGGPRVVILDDVEFFA